MGRSTGGAIMQLEYEELGELETEVRAYFEENLLHVLADLNRSEKLQEFLELIGAQHLIKSGPDYDCHKNGIILIVGACEVSKNDLTKSAKYLGINPERLESYTEYDRVPDLSRIRYNPQYAAILAGPMPHSVEGKGEYSSVIAAWEQEAGYPPVERMGQNGLKISKSAFQGALKKLLDKGVIVTG